MEWRHVYPINDLIKHNTESKGTEYFICECGPEIKLVEGGGMIIHAAMDRREMFENK